MSTQLALSPFEKRRRESGATAAPGYGGACARRGLRTRSGRVTGFAPDTACRPDCVARAVTAQAPDISVRWRPVRWFERWVAAACAVVAIGLLTGGAYLAFGAGAPTPRTEVPAPSHPALESPAAGVFTGRYVDGLPLYVFPTLYVTARRPPG
jgi:hypothetical protein